MNRIAGKIFASGGVRVDVAVPTQFQLCDLCERGHGDHSSVAPTPVETDDVRFDAWSAYLARWSLRYPCRLELRCEKQVIGSHEALETSEAVAAKDGARSAPYPSGAYYLRIGFRYPDERDSRDGVSPAPEGGPGLWPPSLLPDENTPRWLRANLIYHLLHELDEHLTLDGERVFDPHVRAVHWCEGCIARTEAQEDEARKRAAAQADGHALHRVPRRRTQTGPDGVPVPIDDDGKRHIGWMGLGVGEEP